MRESSKFKANARLRIGGEAARAALIAEISHQALVEIAIGNLALTAGLMPPASRAVEIAARRLQKANNHNRGAERVYINEAIMSFDNMPLRILRNVACM